MEYWQADNLEIFAAVTDGGCRLKCYFVDKERPIVKITSQMVKELRDKTNAGMMDCKRALGETDGDMEKAIDLLRQKGLAVAAKRADRATSEGVVECYIHGGGKLGVMVEVGCETDFVAKTDDFKSFARDVAMHIAAANPVAISRDEVPAELIEREKEIYTNQALESGKPENIVEKIVSGKIEKYISEVCLLEQKFVKNPDLTVQDLLNELIAKMGENISIKRFARFQVGA
ncbi:MAG TPA: translation elongation factor Ts [Desulfobulbus sp.]|nr:translation elongation factor Ts [Desulfobulbus sp.]